MFIILLLILFQGEMDLYSSVPDPLFPSYVLERFFSSLTDWDQPPQPTSSFIFSLKKFFILSDHVIEHGH